MVLTFFIAGLLLSLVPLSTSITWERTPHPVRRPAFSSHLISPFWTKTRQDIILLNVDQQKRWPRLIGGRFTAAIGVVVTGYVAALTLRAAFWQSPHHFHWPLAVGTSWPAWA